MKRIASFLLLLLPITVWAQAPQPAQENTTPETRSLFDRIRGNARGNTPGRTIAQPAGYPQGSRPGTTYPQQPQGQQPPPGQQAPQQYPPQNPNQPSQQQPQRPTPTPQATRRPAREEATPTPRRTREATPAPRRATPRPAERAEETDEPKSNPTPKPSAKEQSDLEKMMKDMEASNKEKAKQDEEVAEASDKATTAVASFLKSSNDGEYSKAVTYLTPQIQKYFDSDASVANGTLKTVLDNLTHDGDIRKVTYTNAIVRGEGVTVETELTFGDNRMENHEFDLLKSNNKWFIVLPVTPQEATPFVRQERPAPTPRPTPIPMPESTPAPEVNLPVTEPGIDPLAAETSVTVQE